MMEMWYYTSEGKQMEPVPIPDLKRLVGEGVLKPTDMVWKDGLPRWIRASSVQELFPDPSSSLDQYFSGPAAATETGHPRPVAPKAAQVPRQAEDDEPRRRRRPSAADDDRYRPRRRHPAANNGYGTKILIVSLVGGFILLASLVIGILILATPRGNPRPVKGDFAVKPLPDEEKDVPPPQPAAKVGKAVPRLPGDVKTGNGVLTITANLPPGAEHFVKFRVKAKHLATITVTPLPIAGQVIDLNMQVFKESDNALVVADEKPGPSASVEFTLPATEIVRVRVHNASKRGTATQFTIVYDVVN